MILEELRLLGGRQESARKDGEFKTVPGKPANNLHGAQTDGEVGACDVTALDREGLGRARRAERLQSSPGHIPSSAFHITSPPPELTVTVTVVFTSLTLLFHPFEISLHFSLSRFLYALTC